MSNPDSPETASGLGVSAPARVLGVGVVKPETIIAEHWYMFIPAATAGVTNIECNCGKFRTAGPYSIDEMRKLHAAHVVERLAAHGHTIVQREALARAMYLNQARHHIHPDDSMSPEQSWDEGFFPRKSLWLEQADYILSAAVSATQEER